MSEREEKIVRAALLVFSRYGVRRATMNDIAAEAGIVRQTLYNVYANKDEVMRAVIRFYADHALAAIAEECAAVTELADQLDIVFAHLVVTPWEHVHSTPHADDILTGFNAAAKEEIAIADERYREMIAGLLAPYEKQIAASGLTVHQLSDVIEKSWNGFKHKAATKKQLTGLLRSLKVLVLNVTDTG